MALIEINVSGDFVKVERKLDNIIRQLTRMENRMTKEAEDLKTALDRVKADIAAEIKQLADAIANANGNTAAINEAVVDLNTLADSLEADDPAPTP